MAAQPVFVFVHGAWHGGATWDLILPELAGLDVAGSIAPTLPGADPVGEDDSGSVVADVTQDQRTQVIVDIVQELSGEGNPVVLVGHSLGGLTISHVAEAIPGEVAAVVYLTAMMLPPGIAAAQFRTGGPDDPVGPLAPLFVAGPPGTVRIDVTSQDPDYRSLLRRTFYGDVDPEVIDRFLPTLHPDEPVTVFAVPSPVTPERFGSVDRHYIRCTDDQAIVISAQDSLIDQMDEAMETATSVLTMGTSHSPFLSDPAGLARHLSGIAGRL